MHTHLNPALAAVATAVAATFLASAPAHAGEQQGVKCPDGFEAHISNDNRKLVCSRRYTLQSVCSPAVFAASGLKFNGNIVMDPVGRDGGVDQCFAVGAGRKVDSVMSPPLPGYPALATFERKKHPTGPDKFESSTIEYAFPVGGRDYFGDASKGVQCPAGYDGDKRFNGRGIRCDKNDGPPKTADCDGLHAGIVSIGWRLEVDRRGDEDRCVQTGSSTSDPTKPEGLPGAAFQADRSRNDAGWVLVERNGRDRWQRKVYAWPKSDFPL
jgi:hypothetical protein